MDNKKRILSLSMVVIMTLGVLVWFVKKPEIPDINLTLGVERSLLPAVVWVASDLGYLALSIKEFDSGKASFEAMLNHEGIDILTVAPTPIMFHSFTRNDFAIVATFTHSYHDL